MSYLRELAIYKAGMAHGAQEYDGKPYLWHLRMADQELQKAGFSEGGFARIAVWLHDVLEDSRMLPEREIRELFGDSVADIVVAVTSKPGRNRAERWLKTAPGICANEGGSCGQVSGSHSQYLTLRYKTKRSFLAYVSVGAPRFLETYGMGAQFRGKSQDSCLDAKIPETSGGRTEMKTYTDAELASIASEKLSQLLGYDNGEPFKNPNGTYWSLGSGNNHFFKRDDETGEPHVWCRYPEDHSLCQRVKAYLGSLLDDSCECGAPWCSECTAEAKAIHRRSLEAEANFIAGGLDTEAPPV